jgi:general secretion pathway protein L
MSITIAATPVSLIKPWLDVIASVGVHSVAVLTAPPPGDAAALPIKVWDQRSDALGLARIRKTLVTSLAACGISAAVTMATAAIVETTVENYDAGVTDKLKAIRGAAGRDMDGSLASAKRALERRKYASPSAVMVLDALSEILPDHTYVTELRVEANKVRLIGITRDAPSLVELIEKSGRFTRASFFGPTTRSASEPGERFNIEAIIQPIAPVRS